MDEPQAIMLREAQFKVNTLPDFIYILFYKRQNQMNGKKKVEGSVTTKQHMKFWGKDF